METIFEKDNDNLIVTFYDADGVLVVPTSIQYRIDDIESGTSVRTQAAIAAASPLTIELKYADNTLLDTNSASEGRRVTVIPNFGTDAQGNPKQKIFEFDYEVKNARFI